VPRQHRSRRARAIIERRQGIGPFEGVDDPDWIDIETGAWEVEARFVAGNDWAWILSFRTPTAANCRYRYARSTRAGLQR
jgi:hypothetical protein